MRSSRTRFEHQARKAAHRDMRTHAAFVDDHERAVENVELALLDEQNRGPILDGNGAGGREAGHCRHGLHALRISIKPHP